MHRGQCRRAHGHSYKLEVTISGPVHKESAPDHGMVADFADLSAIVKAQVIEPLDHHDLNEALEIYTTAENLARWIWDRIDESIFGLGPNIRLDRIRLNETESGWVEIEA